MPIFSLQICAHTIKTIIIFNQKLTTFKDVINPNHYINLRTFHFFSKNRYFLFIKLCGAATKSNTVNACEIGRE